MPREKQKLIKLPANPLAILKAMGLTEEKRTAGFKLSLFVDRSLDPALLSYIREAFRPQADNLDLTVIPFFDEPIRLNASSDLVIIMAAKAPHVGDLLLAALREQVPAVVATLDPVSVQRISRDNYHEVDLRSLVTAPLRGSEQERHRRLFQELGSWISRELSDDLLALARALPFIRDPFVRSTIQKTSLQNAVIASVFFLPGADMPLLTLNQVKLFLQIAAVYQADLDKKRFKELAILLASGYGFRMLARRLVTLIPMFGWAVKGTVGYSGTLAIGKAAQEYFERGGDLKSLLPALKMPGKTRS